MIDLFEVRHILNLRVRIRLSLVHALDEISMTCLDELQELDSVSPICLWVSVSGKIILFMKRGGCCGGSTLRERIMENVFLVLKSKNQSAAQLLIILRYMLI